MNNYDRVFTKLSGNYEGNGGTALSMMTKLKRIRIAFVTNLDDKLCSLIGVEKFQHKQVEQLLNKTDLLPAWIANASLLVKKN